MPADRMIRSCARFLLALAPVAALGACNGDPTLYRLAPVAGLSATGGPGVVEVRTPVVAQSIDRDEIVRQDRDYKLKIAKGDAWDEPLGVLIGRTLTADLAARLPGTTVFAQNDAVSTTPQAYVEVTVNAFNEDQKGNARLDATLSVHSAGESLFPVLTTPVQLLTPLDSHATGHLVAALSQMTGQLADQAAARLRALPPMPRPGTAP